MKLKYIKRYHIYILAAAIVMFVIGIFVSSFIAKNNTLLNETERSWLRSRNNKIVYGAHINAPPLRFLDENDGQYKGLVIDYIYAMSLELGIDIETHPYVWNEALSKLAEGETDLCDMFESTERSKTYLFTQPIYNLRGVFVASSDNDEIRSIKDIENIKTVALERGDYTNGYFKTHFPNMEIIYADDVQGALNLLIEGKADGAAGDELVVLNFVNKMHDKSKIKVKVLDPPLYELPVVFAVSKSSPILVGILNKAIDKIDKTNTLEKIQQKWFGLPISIIVPNNRQQKILKYTGGIILLLIILSVIFFYINLSLKKEVQTRTKQLLQAQKMAAIGQLAAGVAHEIRNPLGIIRTYLYIIENKAKHLEEWSQIEKPIKSINKAAERADKIINNLLNLSGTSENTSSWVRLDKIFSEIIELPSKEMIKKGISHSIKIRTEYEYFIVPDSLRMILINVINNAIDAMEHGGFLDIVAADVAVGFEITFKDTGVGMKEETLDYIFNPFFTTKQPGKGTGLGLYITYNEVTRLNGEIKVRSEEGRGTTVDIIIPAKKRRYEQCK